MIPFLDLKKQYKMIRSEILESITTVLDGGSFVLGPAVEEFESKFGRFTDSKSVVAMNSGTSALHLGLLAAGVEHGDEVITVPHTFVATVSSILYTGAKPVFVDIDPDSYTMDPDKLEAAITNKTKVIVPVHLYGQPADMGPIMEIARKHNLIVMEDAAQAHGAEYQGKRCGSIGHLAGFSFYPGKNLGAYGEGGALTTNDSNIAKRARMLRDWGQEKKYHHVMVGYNARMEAIQGAVLSVKMKYIDDWTERRREIANRYNNELAEAKKIILPKIYRDRKHVYHIYCVLVQDRENFMKYLLNEGVGSGIHYPFPIHLLEGYSFLGYSAGQFPVAERVASQCVSIPMYPEMTDSMIESVIAAILKYENSDQ
jgi:dTDP-4-amino-4,6-dideoxygalactose transaminase